MMLNGRPFDPEEGSADLAEVQVDEGAASLDVPDPDTILLDNYFSQPRQQQKMAFPGPDRGRYLLSVAYWSPVPSSGDEVVKEVEYYNSYRMEWTKPPKKFDWVAVSVNAFRPAERDSADVIIPLGECDEGCPKI
jgi:hypothetical protein